ncbi:MAG: Flp pilus assembly complex ATPase component TadA [Oscillospiraceae bacterium]|nr:Flp pilus assembly complex ATPase component TadA [Oscillospiraceae bacterium]MBQ9982104.1 Flp pilus assembly complex ATPase component TadA [Oscillospiraceae bacterium]
MTIKDEKMINLIGFARQMNCTDIHISMNSPAMLRRRGELIKTNFEATNDEIRKMILSMLNEDGDNLIKERTDLISTFETPVPDVYRQRVSIFRQADQIAASIRLLPDVLPSMESLNIPEAVINNIVIPGGITFITGPAGSGKTTSASVILQYVIDNYPLHVITGEDPVEYVFKNGRSTVHQRQIGSDSESFSDVCRFAAIEDTDIIFISDVSDFETLNAIVSSAESGISVIACLNSGSVLQTLDAIDELCPHERRERFRMRLSNVLRSIVTQKLVPATEKSETILINEIMISTDEIVEVLRTDKKGKVNDIMQAGGMIGMHTFNSILVKLCSGGIISKETAIKYSPDRTDLMHYLR